MTSNVPYIITDKSIIVHLDGKPHTVDSSHPQYDDLKTALKDNHDVEELRNLVSVPKYIKGLTFGKVVVGEDAVWYKNKPVHGHLVDRLLNMLSEGFDITPWANFLDRVMLNPSESARDELYLFLEASLLPITPEGRFLAYKKVRRDYTDCHTGTFDNSVGAEPSMKREDCDPNRNNTCSRGLHFCSQSYLSSFHGDRIMVVEIDPADVVSIPSDYNNAKGRSCRYKVVGELGDVKQGKPATVETVQEKSVNKDFKVDETVPNFVGLARTYNAKDVLALRDQFETLTEAAQQAGVARSTFTRWVKKSEEYVNKLKDVTTYGPDGLTGQQLENLVDIEGSVSGAARSLGVAKSTFQGWLKKHRG